MVPPNGIDVTVVTTAVRGQGRELRPDRRVKRGFEVLTGPRVRPFRRGALLERPTGLDARFIPSGGTTFLDRASVRGPALLLPQDGIRGFGRPISLRVIHSGERSQEACRTGRSRRPGCGRAESG
jgi:hypothetical protein